MRARAISYPFSPPTHGRKLAQGAREVFTAEDWRTKLIFALYQLAITISTLALSKRMYDSRELHAAFLLFLFLAAAWNGASFYLRDADAHAAARGLAPASSPIAAGGGAHTAQAPPPRAAGAAAAGAAGAQ